IALAGKGREGTSLAVYRFLERYAGVRWLWPGELGEVVRPRPTITVENAAIEQEPAYLWRDLGPGGALWGADDKWTMERKLGVSEEHQRAQKLWEKHNGFGGQVFYGGHAFGEILPPSKYGAAHPEYFALVKGKRAWEHFDGKHGGQPCTSNPDVVRITADYSEKFFGEHPDYDAFAISLNDGGGFCECDRCRRLDSGAVQVDAADPEGGKGGRRAVITDRIITFANEVAAQVAKKYPGKKLILFAYGPYKQPPQRVKPLPNVIIQYTFHVSMDWDGAAEERQYRETGAWSGATKELGIYEYFIQGNSPDLPRLMLEPIGRSVRRLREQGYRYYQTQAGDGYALNGLNYYALGRLLWDPSADVATLTSDYVESGFGKAAPAVKRYFERLADQWKAQKGQQVTMDAAKLEEYRRVAAAYPADFRAACRADLAEAGRQAQGVERERVRFLERGFQYVELTLEAVEKTLPLLEAGWKFTPDVTPPAGADKAAFRKTMDAWEARGRYVETLKQGFEVAYFWIRYNDQNRSFVPLAKMREYSGHASTGATR
ncbi:MAG TPA: DUF4838 domain-containing protein, partial [Bryobacteraceae bacterium]|nr:DUF4838 domain-containing protein [Bryobacteraceae bacterium]